ncbi:MAG: hypothetical protein O3C51_01685 [Planctomycetota bacterium]|nr:hypothetical protein [Planctomycetota bacterium]
MAGPRRLMRTRCSHCGAENSLFRVLTWWSGLHARCRDCGRVFRLVETAGGVFGVMGAFGLVYLAGLYAVLQVELPADLPRYAVPLLIAGVPAAPGAAAAVLLTGVLHRMGAPDPAEVPRLGGLAYATVYAVATLSVAIIVALGAVGIVAMRFGEDLPRPDAAALAVDLPTTREERVAFAFVDLTGRARDLAELEGQTVLVHVFDPDTRGARQVLESLRQLRKDVQEDVLFAVVADCTRDRLAFFVDQGAPRLPYSFRDGELPAALQGSVRPLTFVVDPDGVIRLQHSGIAFWDTESVAQWLRGVVGG